MQVSIETTTGLERRLTVGIPAEIIDQEVNKRLGEAAKTVRLNGFRKGKVPLRVVKQRFGAGVRQEVLGDTINRSFQEAIQQESIRPAGQPAIEPTQIEEGKDVEFVATFEVYPEIEVTGIEDIEVTKFDAEITDKDVDKMILSLQKAQAPWKDTKGMAKKDDKLNIDFEGKKEGEPFEGGSGNGTDLIIGSGSMIPGFEDGLVGLKAGEEKSLDLTFPDEYHVESLRGQAVVFDVKINSIQRQKLPALDDEFFEKYGVSEGGEEKFREDVLNNMEREKSNAIKNRLKEQVMNGLLKANDFDVPAALVTGEIDALRQQAVQQYGGAAKGMDLKALLPDEMFTEQAKKRTSLGLLISEIISKEKLTAGKEAVRALIEENASTYEDPEEVINYYYSNENLLKSVEAAVLEDEVVEFVIGKSKVSDKKISYEEVLKPIVD